MPDAEPILLVERRDDVLWLTLNRPEKRNALSLTLLDEIGSTLRHYQNDEIKCVLLTGAGARCFAAGGDLKELDAIRSRDEATAMAERGHIALDAIRYFPAPVIGALNGLALGGGAELAMACDMRIGAAHADFGLIQSRLNVTTAWGGGIDLIDAVGNGIALTILTSGRRLSAVDALALGLFDSICKPDQDFAEFTQAYLTAFIRPSINVLRGYKSTAASRRKQLHDALTDRARAAFVESWIHQDHWEAAAKALQAK